MSKSANEGPYTATQADLSAESEIKSYKSPFDGAYSLAGDLMAGDRIAFLGFSAFFLVVLFVVYHSTIGGGALDHRFLREYGVIAGLILLARVGALTETGCYLARLRGEPVRWRDHVPGIGAVLLTAPLNLSAAFVGYLVHWSVSIPIEISADLSFYVENLIGLILFWFAIILSSAAGPSWVEKGARPLGGLIDGLDLIGNDLRGFLGELLRLAGWWFAGALIAPFLIFVMVATKGTFAVAWVRLNDSVASDPYGAAET